MNNYLDNLSSTWTRFWKIETPKYWIKLRYLFGFAATLAGGVWILQTQYPGMILPDSVVSTCTWVLISNWILTRLPAKDPNTYTP